MSTTEACHEMKNGEVLNASFLEYPLLHGVLYGNPLATAKLSKRLSCAIKHLRVRVEFIYEPDIQKAVDAGIRKDPTFVLDGEIFLEGLVQAEEITEAFETKIRAVMKRCDSSEGARTQEEH